MVFSQNWEKLGTGLVAQEIFCLYGDTFDNKLYVGGRITYINDSVFA